MGDTEEDRLAEFSARGVGGVGPSEDAPLPDDESAGFDAGDEDDKVSIDEVVKLSDRELCARRCAIRRAIEERMEQKALDQDLDYLDCDLNV